MASIVFREIGFIFLAFKQEPICGGLASADFKVYRLRGALAERKKYRGALGVRQSIDYFLPWLNNFRNWPV